VDLLTSCLIWLGCSILLGLIHFPLFCIIYKMKKGVFAWIDLKHLYMNGSLFFFGMAICGNGFGKLLYNITVLSEMHIRLLAVFMLATLILMILGAALYTVLAFTAIKKGKGQWQYKTVLEISAEFVFIAIFLCFSIHVFIEQVVVNS
jgi:hypothetical protein